MYTLAVRTPSLYGPGMPQDRLTEPAPSPTIVIDDEPRMLELISSLVDDGVRFRVVGRTSSTDEAVRMAIAYDAEVVLIDVYMPEVDGFEAARRILAQLPDVEVVLMSAVAEDVYEGLSADAGARGFVAKRELSSSKLADVLGAPPVVAP